MVAVATSLSAAIDEVASRDPVLADLVARVGPIQHRPRDPDGPFGALVRAIVFQQLAGRAAQAIHGRVRASVGEALTPEALSAIPTKRSSRRPVREQARLAARPLGQGARRHGRARRARHGEATRI